MTNETLMAIHREACKSMTDVELADTFPRFRIGSPARKAIMAELASRKDEETAQYHPEPRPIDCGCDWCVRYWDDIAAASTKADRNEGDD